MEGLHQNRRPSGRSRSALWQRHSVRSRSHLRQARHSPVPYPHTGHEPPAQSHAAAQFAVLATRLDRYQRPRRGHPLPCHRPRRKSIGNRPPHRLQSPHHAAPASGNGTLRPCAGEAALRTSGKSGRGSSRRYHLKASDWQFLTAGAPLPRWISWPPLWSLVQTLLDALPAPGQADKHPALISSALRDRLATDGEALAAAGLLPLLNLRSGATGLELLDSIEVAVPSLLESL